MVKLSTVYTRRTLDALGAFNFEKRFHIYKIMDELANELWRSPKQVFLRKERDRRGISGSRTDELGPRWSARSVSYFPSTTQRVKMLDDRQSSELKPKKPSHP